MKNLVKGKLNLDFKISLCAVQSVFTWHKNLTMWGQQLYFLSKGVWAMNHYTAEDDTVYLSHLKWLTCNLWSHLVTYFVNRATFNVMYSYSNSFWLVKKLAELVDRPTVCMWCGRGGYGRQATKYCAVIRRASCLLLERLSIATTVPLTCEVDLFYKDVWI